MVLFIGFWAPLVIIAILTFATFENHWIWGLIGFIVLQIIVVIVSWQMSGLAYGEWSNSVAFAGARRMSRTMLRLNREEGNRDLSEMGFFEHVFDYWFCLSIKFFTPTLLTFLLASKLVSNINDAYGGYHAGWQVIGLLFPAVGLAFFILCIFMCTEKDDFGDDAETAMAEGKQVEMAANPSSTAQ